MIKKNESNNPWIAPQKMRIAFALISILAFGVFGWFFLRCNAAIVILLSIIVLKKRDKPSGEDDFTIGYFCTIMYMLFLESEKYRAVLAPSSQHPLLETVFFVLLPLPFFLAIAATVSCVRTSMPVFVQRSIEEPKTQVDTSEPEKR